MNKNGSGGSETSGSEVLVSATMLLSSFGLSHGVDAFDCMIAATSQRLNMPVLTRNLKHFRPLIGGLAILPY